MDNKTEKVTIFQGKKIEKNQQLQEYFWRTYKRMVTKKTEEKRARSFLNR